MATRRRPRYHRAPKIGTLQIGAPGDCGHWELVGGRQFVDTRNNKPDARLLKRLDRDQRRAVGPAVSIAVAVRCRRFIKYQQCSITIWETHRAAA